MLPGGPRALWVWVPELATDPVAQDAFFAFCASHDVESAYLDSQSLLPAEQQKLGEFIASAAAKGISVELLFGKSSWAKTSGHSAALQVTQNAVDFAAQLSGPKPSGLHFDVEPHTLPEWSTDQAGPAGQYLDLLDKLAAVTSPAGLRLTVDIAFWYDTVQVTRAGQTRPLSEWVIDAVDRAPLMDYRDMANGPDGIIAQAANEVTYAAQKNKKVVIGVETNCGLMPTKITFCEEGAMAMEQELSLVRMQYSSSAGFAGLAVHDYEGFSALPP